MLSCETISRLVNPACRKLCSYRSIFTARSHSETEPQAESGGGTRWSNRGWDELRDRGKRLSVKETEPVIGMILINVSLTQFSIKTGNGETDRQTGYCLILSADPGM